jgi:hypothetical protein
VSVDYVLGIGGFNLENVEKGLDKTLKCVCGCVGVCECGWVGGWVSTVNDKLIDVCLVHPVGGRTVVLIGHEL